MAHTALPFLKVMGAVGVAFGVLSACAPSATIQQSTPTGAASTNGEKATGPAQAFARFPDIPVLAGAKINLDKSVVFGSGETWFGRLTLSAGHGANSVFDFYKQELSGFGWQEITSVRSATSILTYERQDRIASIQISEATLQGSNILITVSPRRGSAQAPASLTTK